MNAAWCLGVKQVVGSDLATSLLGLGAAEVLPVPSSPLSVVEAEEMNFFDAGQEHIGMLAQQMVERGCPSFLCSQNKEIRPARCCEFRAIHLRHGVGSRVMENVCGPCCWLVYGWC
jgi:hypothetical protein